MKKFITIILFFFVSKTYGQIDSNLIYKRVSYIINLIEDNNIDSLLINSTDTIRCLTCPEAGRKQYINAKIFFTERLKENFSPKLIAKLRTSSKMIVKEKEPYPAYVVFFKVLKRGEYAPNHEGASFGIWLRADNNLKFAAIESIP